MIRVHVIREMERVLEDYYDNETEENSAAVERARIATGCTTYEWHKATGIALEKLGLDGSDDDFTSYY